MSELWKTQPEWEISIERENETQLLVVSSGQLYFFDKAIKEYNDDGDYNEPFVYEINGFEVQIDFNEDVKIWVRSIAP